MTNPPKVYVKRLALMLIPLLVLALTVLAKYSHAPYYLSPDPTYQYLFCSLHILNDIPPSHVDHPGTPAQIGGAIALKLYHLNLSGEEIVRKVVDNPEFYIALMNSFFVALFLGTLWLIGIYAYRKSKDLTLSMLLQCIPALVFFGGLYKLTYMKSEMMLYVALNLFVLCTLKLFYDVRKKDSYLTAVLLGGVCGLAIATKVTTAPFVLLGIFLLPSWKARGLFVLSVVGGFVLTTIPIISRYPKMVRWLHGLLTHTGSYGGGAKGIIKWEIFQISLKAILIRQKVMIGFCLVALFSAIAKLVFNSKSLDNDQKKASKFIGTLAIIFILEILMVAKHPADHYLIPACSLTGLLVFFTFLLFKPSKVRTYIAIVVLTLVIAPWTRISQARMMVEMGPGIEAEKKLYEFEMSIREKYKHCNFIHGSAAQNIEFALNWGDHWERYMKFGAILKKKYPNVLLYDMWEKQIHDFEREGPLRVMLPYLQERSSCTVLYSGCSNKVFYDQDMNLDIIEKDRATCLFKINSLKEKKRKLTPAMVQQIIKAREKGR